MTSGGKLTEQINDPNIPVQALSNSTTTAVPKH